MFFRTITNHFACILLAAFAANAQQLNVTHYTVNDGMLSNNIRKIFQDSRGFLWIGTTEGISKYDGHRFHNYTTANGMPHDLVNDMIETSDSTLIFACNDGSLAWIKNNRIEKVTKPGIVINHFYRAPSGKTLAVTDKNGIQEFEDGKLYKPPQAFPNLNYFSITAVNDSLFLAGSDSSVQLLTKDYRLVKVFNHEWINYGENRVFADSKGRMWTSHLRGLAMLSKDGIVPLPATLQIYPISAATVQQIYEDRSGNMWFAAMYGLVKWDTANRVNIFRRKDGLSSEQVTSILEDKENNLWIGTNNGLCKIQSNNPTNAFDLLERTGTSVINFIYNESDERLMLGTWKGSQYYYKKDGRLSDIIPSHSLAYVTQNIQGSPLLITDDGQPVLRNTKAGDDLHKFLARNPTRFMHAAKDSGCTFFMSGEFGFYIYDGQKVFSDFIDKYLISGIAADNKGAVWIGTWGEGLIRIQYENKNGTFRILKKDTLLPKIAIRAVMADKDGNIWAGTRYQGLFKLTRDGENHFKMEQWNNQTGLSSNWIYKIVEDEKKNIWVAYTYGVDKLVRQANGSYRVFDFSRVNNFFANIHHITPDGNGAFWLATENNGLVHLKDNEREKTFPWPVYITTLSIGDSLYSPVTMPQLAYRGNSLKIDFTASTYINEKQVLYSYRLTGSGDTSWTRPDNNHSVSFASLRPGKYQFEVRTLGWNGQWGKATVFQFNILPPLWQRTWFIAVCFLALAGIVTLAVRRRIKTIRKESDMKQQLAETEMMALRAQMNPHFLFNSLNAIDNLIQTHQHDKATTYLGRFARLLRLVLDSSKNKQVPFESDFTAMQLYLDMEKFRSTGKFQFDISAEPELLNGGYRIPPLLAQPFIENAIHHGLMNKQTGDRMLTVKATLQDDFIVFDIADNGVGRSRAKEINMINRPIHTSYGWQITAQRLGLYNGGNGENYITVRDLFEGEEAAGTSVTLKIKVNAS